uniref:RNA-directed RNA polymerase catalytic subunit n=1 Tax=Jingshan Fly Virus 1 TaxID=1608053 RepID=A0A0B5KER9_9ORTO|nr:PB1 [Jingshan Fly Virus 1]APG77897.1 polymerase PB1 [Jingshan Fly Virus 1]
MTTNDPFEDIPNSMLDAVFRKTRKRKDIAMPESESLNTLGMVSSLYLYANPPPMAYGTPAPKIAETVLRAYDFNLKKYNKSIKIGRFLIDNPVWENEGYFPFEEVASNWHPGQVHEMAKAFLESNIEQITSLVDQVIEYAFSVNSDVLTKGKQTWDPLTERSVPSAQAYSEMADMMVSNELPNHHTLLGFIKNISVLMNKEVILSKAAKSYEKIQEKRVESQRIKSVKKQSKVIGKQYEKDDAFYHILDLIRSFCGYNKSGERAHLKRRAIASPSIPLRAFLLILEEFHLKLGKRIRGSTISIGGDEKKMKIINTMNSANTDPDSTVTLQATQDATKWNECLSASGFCMMSKTFFDPEVRRELRLPPPTNNELLFLKICETSHFFLAIKRIFLGNGLQGRNQIYHGEMDFTKENLLKFNKNTQEWVKRALPLMEGNYLQASGGMLMGMHNALSTTMGLISVGFKKPAGTGIYTLRSSDDSMTLYSGPNKYWVAAVIDRENLNLKACGINLSKKKTFIFQYGYGEYTSWYQDGKMVAQYGPETTTLRPGGNNPPDDFNNLARTTSVSLLRMETNEIGAEAKLRLGVNNIRSLYRIKIKSREHQGIKDKCLLLSDGGLNPWDCSNCHLEETCLKEYYKTTKEEEEYFLKIRNPDNPFSSEPKEEITWSKDEGTLSLEYVETPRTVFHFVKRANRAITNIKGPTHADSERAHAEALNLLTMADISTLVRTPASSITMADHMVSCIRTMASNSGISKEELDIVSKAIKRLREGDMEQIDEDIVDDIDLDSL